MRLGLSLEGWIRTGCAGNTVATPGTGNCSTWSSARHGDDGTLVSLRTDWTSSTSDIHVWDAGAADCAIAQSVWCVSDVLTESAYLPIVIRS